MSLDDHLESIICIDCSRCSTVGLYYGTEIHLASEWFGTEGWRVEENSVYCPACKDDVYPG